MDEDILEKLEREELSLASVNKRGWAYFIDELIVSFLITIIYWDRFSSVSTPEDMILVMNGAAFYVVLLKIIYQAFFVWRYGATLGKMAMKIRVVDREIFEIPSFGDSLIRSVVRIVSEMFFYLGFVWAFFNPLREAWHDKAAKTLVIDA